MLLAAASGLLLEIVLAAIGGLLALFGVYLVVLAVAALVGRRGEPAVPEVPPWRITVLVPAHDEETLIGRCVSSLLAQTYPGELFEVVVVADNCTDGTAVAAAESGARVLVRDAPDSRGKGRALRWALEHILASPQPPDAVAVVDADSIADPRFLVALATPLGSGAQAIQGESLLYEDGTRESALRAAAFLLVNRVRPAGRAVLGLPCGLGGNGMLFVRSLLEDHPWSAFTSAEDVEYALQLRRAGVRPVFARGAILRSPPPPNPQAAMQQQLRWEGGKYHLLRTQLPTLVAAAVSTRSLSLLDTAFELAIPPLGYLAGASAATAAVSVGLAAGGIVSVWTVWPAVIACAAVPTFVFLGLWAADAPSSAYGSLLRAPVFVLRKVARSYRLFGFSADTWVRTERDQENR